jgi:large subunit ribosomal protein L15
MNLNEVHRGITKHKKRRRVGRGPGSGWGKTSGRGHKGQGQLAGWSTHPAFEGGQMPLSRRIPKRGFNNQWAVTVKSVNLGQLDALFSAGDAISPESLESHFLAKSRYDVLKVLGNGELTKPLKISAHRFSASALEKIKAAGGEAIVLDGPKPVIKNKTGSRKAAKVASVKAKKGKSK